MPRFRQTCSASCRAALKGFNQLRAEHGVDLAGKARGARIAHAHRFGGGRNRTKRINMLHQLRLTAAKARAARQDNFQAKFKLLCHWPKINTSLAGVQ